MYTLFRILIWIWNILFFLAAALWLLITAGLVAGHEGEEGEAAMLGAFAATYGCGYVFVVWIIGLLPLAILAYVFKRMSEPAPRRGSGRAPRSRSR